MAEHTKGPWKLLRRGDIPAVREIIRPGGESPHYRADVVQELDKPARRHVAGLHFGYGSPQNESDARLIAAAPELLCIAKRFLDLMGQHGEWDDGCFYYSKRSELQEPITQFAAIIKKAEVPNA